MDSEVLDELVGVAVVAARAAGALVADARLGEVRVERKAGGGTLASQVVTRVDREAQDCILEGLREASERFGLGTLAEESPDDGGRFAQPAFWCIDPIDGTLPFTENRPGYAVSIGLVRRDGTPELGVVFDPVTGRCYHARRGGGAFCEGERFVVSPATGGTGQAVTVVTGSSFGAHPDTPGILAALAGQDRPYVIYPGGGTVMNAIRVVESAPACCFKLPKPTDGCGSLWDFAAVACLLDEAGAVATDFHGGALDLNRSDGTFMNHRGSMLASSAGVAAWMRDVVFVSVEGQGEGQV